MPVNKRTKKNKNYRLNLKQKKTKNNKNKRRNQMKGGFMGIPFTGKSNQANQKIIVNALCNQINDEDFESMPRSSDGLIKALCPNYNNPNQTAGSDDSTGKGVMSGLQEVAYNTIKKVKPADIAVKFAKMTTYPLRTIMNKTLGVFKTHDDLPGYKSEDEQSLNNPENIAQLTALMNQLNNQKQNQNNSQNINQNNKVMDTGVNNSESQTINQNISNNQNNNQNNNNKSNKTVQKAGSLKRKKLKSKKLRKNKLKRNKLRKKTKKYRN